MQEFLKTAFGRKVVALALAGAAFVAAALVKEPQSRLELIGLGSTLGALAVSLGGKDKEPKE